VSFFPKQDILGRTPSGRLPSFPSASERPVGTAYWTGEVDYASVERRLLALFTAQLQKR
jgi:hypothetical protein